MNQYEPNVIALAKEVAEKLNDRESINSYLAICHKYKEEHVRKILDRVLAIPIEDIRKTPGALFTYLVHNHAVRAHPWD